MNRDDLTEATRRAVLKGVAGALGVAATGTASAHPGAGDHGEEGHEHPAEDAAGATQVGYHSLGGVGSTSASGQPEDPHYGGISEMKVQDDLAFVAILSSKDPTYDRGMAILDVSDYTRAESKAELAAAEPVVLSFLPNENNATSIMDVKLSSDGNYAFLAKQPIAATFRDEELLTDPGNAGNAPEAGALYAVDVSDPRAPEIVGRWDAWGLGPHNSDHLRIGGTDYVFAVKGPIGSNAGIYVLRFDRSSGTLTPVNYWTEDTNAATGEFGDPSDDQDATNGYELYMHDIRVERDPQTGHPLAYAANFHYGGLVLDVADPTDIAELGRFEMYRSHEIWPITVTAPDGPRRMFVTGQENPSSEWSENIDNESGWLYLVDAQELSPGEQEESIYLGKASTRDDFDPSSDEPELAKWALSDDVEFENYTLSLHNVEPFEVEIDGQPRQFVAAGHYHGGVRVLEFTEAVGWDVKGPGPRYLDAGIREVDGSPPANGEEDGMGEVAYFRSHEEGVPTEAKMSGLTEATPDFWCGVQQNGVVFASGINTGVYAFTVDPDRGKPGDSFARAPTAPDVPVGTDQPDDVQVTRRDAADAYTAGQTARFELSVTHDAAGPVRVYDRVSTSWDVFENSGDVEAVRDVGDGTLVDLGEVASGDTVTYFVDVGQETGTYTVGEVLYTADGYEFNSVAGTVDGNVIVGASTNL